MELVSMAAYRSRFQPNLQHTAPRGTGPRLASLATWTGHRLSEEQALADTITKITADFERPRLAVVTGEAVDQERDWKKWQRIRLEQTGGRCPRCFGKGWMPAYKHTDVDDYIDCELCGPLQPRQSYDDIPF